MPKITSIKQQKRLTDRFSLYVDGKFDLGVDGSLIVKYDLHVGTELTPKLRSNLENADRTELAYMGLLNFISFRERCEFEVHEWLFKKGFLDLEDDLVSRLKSKNYLNDERFTKLFVRDRINLKGWGPTRLRHELARKRIDRSIIENMLDDINEEYDFLEIANTLIQKKLRFIERPTYKDKKRIFNLLQRRGFTANLISQALESTIFYREDDSLD